ncbi:hypothetical protein CRG98_025207 [Punica granatum]|uniref:Methyltransferase type 11 domain-containing protein n=1 Tax=Punica granatum TaxID=22663 RepID=A0A2I0JER3_PUNGR|nr:hypothetical protein CRG98_025207 [Punica granatum]
MCRDWPHGMGKESLDSPQEPARTSIRTNLLFLFLLLSTNLLTFFISITFYSSCSLTSPILTPSTASAKPIVDLPPEFVSFTSGQLLPLGFNSNFSSSTIYPPGASTCTHFPDERQHYMTYNIKGSCPDDELHAQKLLLRGCRPLPRCRCRPAAPQEFVKPYLLPISCEKTQWTALESHDGLNFTTDEVLATKKPGTRIGLDIGGGVTTFAVRMMQRNITIVTTSMNLNGPFNSFIASRGVIPLYISISQRLSFLDSTLDIVQSMHVLSNWIPTTLLHFFMFDMYRVLSPGGLFWLDHFFCSGDQLEQVYAPLIESTGFAKLK